MDLSTLSRVLESFPPAWDSGTDTALVCRAVVPNTPEVSTFLLESPEPRRFRHLPGQHMTVTVEIGSQVHSRCYTISSPPTRPYQLAITVKREPGGIVSKWLHDCFRVGDRIHASGPQGTFSLVHHPADRYLFLAGGVGITPLIAMIRTLHDVWFGRTDVVLVHNVHSPEQAIFRAELDYLSAVESQLHVTTICQSPISVQRWTGPFGRLTPSLLTHAAPDVVDREIFLCGPPSYVNAVREMLFGVGVLPARVHTEPFQSEKSERASFRSQSSCTEDCGPTEPGPYLVEFRQSNRTVECASDSTILQAATRSGITLQSSCGQGLCGACKSTLLAGSVDMHHSGGIHPREIDDGQILICCSKPLEDLIIDA